MVKIVCLLLTLVITRNLGDRFTENVENFAIQSLKEFSTQNCSLYLERAIVPDTPNGIYNLQGAVTNPIFSGLTSITNITTIVRSLTRGEQVNLEYSFIITSPIISGQYDIGGYIGSPVLPFNGSGDFQIKLSKPVNLSCTIEFTSNNGFIRLGDRCFLFSADIDMTDAQLDFQGIVETPLLDSKLKLNILRDVVEHFNIFYFSRSITDAAFFHINGHLHQNFQATKLLDIILTDKPEHHYHLQQNFFEDNLIGSNSVVEDRLCNFVIDSILTLSDSTEDPYPLGSFFNLDNFRSALFPSSGILSDLKLSGFSNLSNVRCSSRTASQVQFSIEFELFNVTLSGMYNITGSIVGETLVSSTGEFTIQSEKGATFIISPSYRNVEGHLSHDWSYTYQFTVLSDTFVTSFPGLLDGIVVDSKVATVILDSIGSSVFCPPDVFCSYNFIAEPMRTLIVEHLQQRFLEVAIVDIITILS